MSKYLTDREDEILKDAKLALERRRARTEYERTVVSAGLCPRCGEKLAADGDSFEPDHCTGCGWGR